MTGCGGVGMDSRALSTASRVRALWQRFVIHDEAWAHDFRFVGFSPKLDNLGVTLFVPFVDRQEFVDVDRISNPRNAPSSTRV
ncbi:MAG: hypothetical protein M2R45_02813 [Verrucomicrobia subdivision 3 bacterium]|nr:hypothetical protein [Limisphaerales bacterium]MCS1414365.1 hypothetical protein [Limisphaerales bacterium]